MTDIQNHGDWKKRASAAKRLTAAVEEHLGAAAEGSASRRFKGATEQARQGGSAESLPDQLADLRELVGFLGQLLLDSNFSIALTGVQIAGDLATFLAQPNWHRTSRVVLTPLLPLLATKLGDSKVVVRHSALAALEGMIRALGPGPVLTNMPKPPPPSSPSTSSSPQQEQLLPLSGEERRTHSEALGLINATFLRHGKDAFESRGQITAIVKHVAALAAIHPAEAEIQVEYTVAQIRWGTVGLAELYILDHVRF